MDAKEIQTRRAQAAFARFQETGRLTCLEETKDALVALGWLRCDVGPDGEKSYSFTNEDRVRWLLGDPNDS